MRDPRSKPAAQLGRVGNKLAQYALAELPEDYNDTKHGMVPYFVRYEGLLDVILTQLDLGATQEDAAVYAGISKDTFKQWLRRGRRAREKLEEGKLPETLSYWDPYYITLVEILETHEAEYKIMLLQRIQEAGKDQWQPNAWILERRWKDQFSLRRTVEHTGEGGGPVKFTLDLGERSDDVLKAKETPIEAEYEIEE